MRSTGAVVTLSAVDAAGNVTTLSEHFSPADVLAPTIKEYIPADGSRNIANGPDGKAHFNVVFSETVEKGSGRIRLYKEDGTLVEAINVTSDQVIVQGNDVYFTPNDPLVAGTHYYVTFDANSFKDVDGNPFAGLTAAEPGKWDFTAATIAIKPDFVAVDDVINNVESQAAVTIQ